MENLALISSYFPIPIGKVAHRRPGPHRTVYCQLRTGATPSSSALEKLNMQRFASISSSTVNSTPPSPMACPASFIGSPILWIGVGVALSALFSVVATELKRQAILHAFKTVMGPDAPQSGQFSTAAFSPGSPFPFPAESPLAPITPSQTPVSSQPSVNAYHPATNVEALPPTDVKNKTEQVKEATSHELSTPLLKQTPLASKPPVTVDAPTTKIEAITPITQVEASPPTTVKDYLN